MKHLSIGQRMQRAKSLDSRRAAALDWTENWHQEHDGLVRDLERAVSRRDWDAAARTTGQLKAVGEKRLTALGRVIEALADEDVA